jgi:hypothetical protein
MPIGRRRGESSAPARITFLRRRLQISHWGAPRVERTAPACASSAAAPGEPWHRSWMVHADERRSRLADTEDKVASGDPFPARQPPVERYAVALRSTVVAAPSSSA